MSHGIGLISPAEGVPYHRFRPTLHMAAASDAAHVRAASALLRCAPKGVVRVVPDSGCLRSSIERGATRT